jgi:SAM-dependent methyltransferase
VRVYGVAKVTGDSQLQSDVLENLSDAHQYRRWLADLARPYLGEEPVEVGSGMGDYALEWASGVSRFTATEADDTRLAALAGRLSGHQMIETRRLLLGDDGGHHGDDGGHHHDHHGGGGASGMGSAAQHSAAVAVNVLEHIPDDVAALRTMAALVRPGGAVVLIVPAFPSAMSSFDWAIGHQRRYTRSSLRAALRAAGLVVEQLRYVNPIGLVGWYVTVKVLGRSPHNGALLRIYDRTVVPLARLLDRLPAPFGQSVFAVARVPAAP